MKRRTRKIKGTAERPRLSVYRSLRHIHAQVIDDNRGRTIVGVSTEDKTMAQKLKRAGNKEAAKIAGALLAEKAKKAGIEKVVFDRGRFLYHGRIKEFADSARAGGLKF